MDEKSSGQPLPTRVRELRQARGLTLKQLSAQTGIFFTQISKLERGDQPAKLGELDIIAAALSVPTADLMLREKGGLGEDERHIVECYRSLDETTRHALAAFLTIMQSK